MTPLQDFADTMMKVRKKFNADRDRAAWLVFYETKQSAYAKLVGALPQLKEIQDFWRYVQSMRATEWLPIIEAEVARITRSKSLCHDCGAVEINWPERRCAQCKRARRLDTYRKAKERARVKQRMRKCPRCKAEPLNARQRVCFSCQANARRGRNRRYQKSLKHRKLRRVQAEFTREATSTVPAFQPATLLAKNVEREGVLGTEAAA
jgi:hypothetical protein